MGLRTDFLWGSATASYQCEGAWNVDGKAPSMWDDYLHKHHLENGDIASDHYHHYKEDIRMMSEGGQNSYRLSLSWPRIIKNKEGDINQKGIQFYREVLQTCKEYHIEPFVTLYHWDLPQYWECTGGWLNEEVCHAFAHYAKVCFDAFGDLVNYWVTFNEPKWFTTSGYLIGNYPPGHQNTQEMICAAYHVMYASSLGVKVFKEGKYTGQIGIVHSFGPVDGIDNSFQTKIAMRFADNYANNWILDTVAKGKIPFDLLCVLSQNYDLSFIKDEQLETIKNNTVQFLGLNYYSRVLVKPYTQGDTVLVVNNTGKSNKGKSKVIIKGWFEQIMDNPDAIYTEWDTEIYPQGLEKGLLEVYKRYHLPIYITENGIGVREKITDEMLEDDYRISFMNDHINSIMNAVDKGVDVRGYYAWSSFDLYSWKNGVEKRYGLVGINFDDALKRIPKKSYYWYKKIIADNGNSIERKEWNL
ncbi:glycoside hydrolase family 1 protein [Faecalicoccus pleomorphus]|uniref:glycoside hydrolase family 1 protein n=1 Tax=Faecalicoccus pleomorphus TaxID=1323 RepID=UPI003DA2740F